MTFGWGVKVIVQSGKEWILLEKRRDTEGRGHRNKTIRKDEK